MLLTRAFLSYIVKDAFPPLISETTGSLAPSLGGVQSWRSILSSFRHLDRRENFGEKNRLSGDVSSRFVLDRNVGVRL